MKLYYKNRPHDQASIIDEETGHSIGIVYDKKNAPLIAASIDLLEACKGAVSELKELDENFDSTNEVIDKCLSAIAKAEEKN